MRKRFVAGNWKMFKTVDEAVVLAEALKGALGDTADCEVAVCPTSPSLHAVSKVLQNSPIGLGAQNMHWEKEGAFTGEVSAAMLLTVGCSYVILGHSERRQLFGETDEGVNRKLHAALAAGLTPIVCVGETLEERQAERIEEVVLGQVRAAFAGVDSKEAAKVVLAYEPVWAIGTGLTATPDQAEEVHRLIRNCLQDLCGAVADQIRIQYGGSVKPENAAELFAQENIDGGLIGGAALQADSFAAIVKA
jgi:triosephosphate isomerase (TIM)